MLEREQAREVLAVVVEEPADAEEELGAARERERAPVRERRLRRLHGAVDFLGAREVDGAGLDAERRVVDRARPPRLSLVGPPPIQWLIGFTAVRGASIVSVISRLLASSRASLSPGSVSAHARRPARARRGAGPLDPDRASERAIDADGYTIVTSLDRASVERIRLAPDEVDRAIAETRAIGRERGLAHVTWWLGELTTPSGLADRLARARPRARPRHARDDEPHDRPRARRASRPSRCAASRPPTSTCAAIELDWDVWDVPEDEARRLPPGPARGVAAARGRRPREPLRRVRRRRAGGLRPRRVHAGGGRS